MMRDSDGNVRQQMKAESDTAVGHGIRLGLTFGWNFVYNTQAPELHTEAYWDTGVTARWKANKTLQLDAMLGASRAAATTSFDGEPIPAATTTAKLIAHLTPHGEDIVIDLGFNRQLFSLSPLILMNRVVRNDFVVRPQFALPSGWRVRGLAEVGPLRGTNDRNARYNSEFTVAHVLGKNSEVYSSCGILHYAQASEAGYYSPNLVHTLEVGWSREIETRPLSLSFEIAAGTGHAQEHGQTFGPWGASLRVQSDLAWKIRPGGEVLASFEYDYNQFNPAVQESTSQAWSMTFLTVSFRWGKQGKRKSADRLEKQRSASSTNR
jgi:hypothetical protein